MAGWIHARQQQRDHAGQRNTCAACGRTGASTDPLVVSDTGMRVHQQHTEDPTSGLYGHQQHTD